MTALFRVIKLPKYNRVGVESVYSLSDYDYIGQLCLRYVQIIKKILRNRKRNFIKTQEFLGGQG